MFLDMRLSVEQDNCRAENCVPFDEGIYRYKIPLLVLNDMARDVST